MSETAPQGLMGWIIRSSLRFRYLVVAAAAGMMVRGITTLPHQQVDVFPEFAPPRVLIQTACLGLSTSDVEQLVTVPLEVTMSGIQGLDDLRSKSVPQLSEIELLFKPGTDLLRARQLVQERLATVSPSLPTWAAPPVMLAPIAATSRAMKVGMTSSDHSLINMSMTAYWTVRARLLRVPGVANVAIWNERLQMMAVLADPPKMRTAGVSLNQLMDATGEAVDSGLLRFSSGSVIGTAGFIDTPNQRSGIRNVLPVVTPGDLAQSPVTRKAGKTVRIGDVATVAERHQPLIGDAIIGGGPGLMLIVEKLPWANTMQLTADVENITRRLREERLAGGKRSTSSVILSACLEVRSPIVYATLIIVAAAIPVFLLTGLTGAFFQPLMLSYTLAIVASMVVALTVTPALTLVLLRGAAIERRKSPVVGWLQRAYTAGLSRVIVRPVAAYVTFGLVTVAGVVVYPQLGQSLFPDFKERDFLAHWVAAPGTSSAEMARTTTKVSRELRAIPGVQSVGAHIGQAFQGDEIHGVNFGELWVSLSPRAGYDSTLDRIRTTIGAYPGLYRDVQTYLDERINEVLTGGKEAIIVRTFGDDLATLRAKSDQILAEIAEIPGIVDEHREISSDIPQVNVKVNLARAERYGLKPGDVRRMAATLVAGEEVGDIFRAGKAYDVVVWSRESDRHSFSDVQNLPIDTPSGGRVRLGTIADVSLQPNPNSIERQGTSRYLDVGANVSGRDLGSVVNDVKQKLAAVHLDRGYHVELLGEYTERQSAQSRLPQSSLIAGVLILLLLQASFRRWRLAVLTYPEEFENGKFTGAPSTWIRGVSGAYGGRHMLAQPREGVQYVAGRIPAIDFYDVARIERIGEAACVSSRCYRQVLVVNEWSPGDRRGGLQIKYYTPGVGLVRVGAHGGDSREFLGLHAVRRLSRPELAEVRSAVLAMERRAYHISEVYRTTTPVACCQQ